MIGSTLLLRQIHPNFIQNGFASSAAFRPNHSDRGLMSVYDGNLISAEASFIHYTTTFSKKSDGTTGVTVDECTAENLSARSDPEPFPEHAVVDFIGVEENAWRSKSKKLQAKASARGWLHRVPASN